MKHGQEATKGEMSSAARLRFRTSSRCLYDESAPMSDRKRPRKSRGPSRGSSHQRVALCCRRRCSDVSQDSFGEAPPSVAAHGLCHAFLGSKGATSSDCGGGVAAAAAVSAAAEACSGDFLLQDTPLKGLPLEGTPFRGVGGSSDMALCSPDGSHILGLLASPFQPCSGGQSDLGSPFDFRSPPHFPLHARAHTLLARRSCLNCTYPGRVRAVLKT